MVFELSIPRSLTFPTTTTHRACALASAVVVLVGTHLFRISRETNAPTGPRLPYVLNLLEVAWNWPRAIEWVCEMNERLKYKTFTIRIPFQGRFYSVSDPTCVEYILKSNFDNFVKGEEFHRIFSSLLGDGIFTVDGERWKVQRKIASNLFNVRNFRDNMAGVFHTHARKLCDRLERAAVTGEAVDMQDLFQCFTIDSISEIAFGIDLDCTGKGSANVPFAAAFDGAQYTIQKRFVLPLWSWLAWFNPEEYALQTKLRIMRDFAFKVIQERRKGSGNGNDLLSIFMNRTNTDGEEFSDAYLADLVMNFMIAGRDTTANSLSWTTWLLSQHTEIRAKMMAEIDAVTQGGPLSYDQQSELRYTHGVISESLRLYPSVPKDPKVAVADDVLPDGTRINKGEWVIYMPYSMGRREDLWPQARRFWPERWFDGAGNIKNESQFKFVSFQAGPRICLGQNMAYQEMKVVLASIFQKYTLELVPGTKVVAANTVTLPMANPLMMTVKRR